MSHFTIYFDVHEISTRDEEELEAREMVDGLTMTCQLTV
jgi:hypothetical protein